MEYTRLVRKTGKNLVGLNESDRVRGNIVFAQHCKCNRNCCDVRVDLHAVVCNLAVMILIFDLRP